MADKPALISPAERAEQQRLQRAMLRQALGAQYPIWTKSDKKRKKMGDSEK